MLVAASAADVASAQRPAPPRGPLPLARLDAIIARRSAVHGGVGGQLPIGTYVRLEAVAGAGTLFTADGPRFSARADVAGHFLLDPYRRRNRGPYAGAGLSAVRETGRTRANVLLLVGIETRARRGYSPAVELGLGGGVRVGVVVRRARAGRR